jgi:hypothetical protein
MLAVRSSAASASASTCYGLFCDAKNQPNHGHFLGFSGSKKGCESKGIAEMQRKKK